MANENYSYMLLIVLVFATGLYTGKLIQIRVRRDLLLHKYKQGTAEYTNILKLLSLRRLILAIFVTLLSILLLAYYVYKNAHFNSFLYILALALVIIGLGFVVVPKAVLGANNRKNKD